MFWNIEPNVIFVNVNVGFFFFFFFTTNDI